MNIEASVWKSYHQTGIVKSDDELLLMIGDVVETIITLETIFGVREANLVVRSLIQEWNALRMMADARGMKDYARP